jgi:NTE family protein
MAFAFLPQPFDLICADLARFPLARAVAASNAFPVLFTPITLENHRGAGCSSALPPFPDAASVAADFRQRALDQAMRRFADAARTPFLHLMDGGIADNLAMRHVLATIGAGGERGEDYIARILPVRRMLMLVVDGQAATDPALSRRRVVYGLGTIVNAVSGGQIDNYNLETLALAEAGYEHLTRRNIAIRCAVAPMIDGHPCDDVRFLVARVALADHPDAALRARLQAIPTGLTIAAADAALLLAAGEAMVRADARLRDFLASLEPAGP